MRELTIWLKMWKIASLAVFTAMPLLAASQLTLDSAQAAARRNYPLIRQKDLVRKTADLNISNLGKAYLPQLSFSGQASYQSDVTRVDVPVPGVKIEPPAKDQYRVVADINQLIYDGGQTRHQQVLQELNAVVEDQRVEVELFKLQDRINQVYLGILYLDAQAKQVELIRQDLQAGINKVEAQVQHGVAFRSNLYVLQAELLKTGQRQAELKAARQGMLEVLSLFMGQPLDLDTQLQQPRVAIAGDANLSRPELRLFNDQARLLDHQYKLINARNLPRASLFVQGGYGRPGLNMLKNEFDPYYIAGIRFNWSLGGLYTRKKDRQLVEVNRNMVDIQKETFVFNTNAQIAQQQSEIQKLQELVSTDSEIISLRVKIKEAAHAQLDNGVITANDYLREVTAEDQARQLLITHQLQLLQAQINYLNILGK